VRFFLALLLLNTASNLAAIDAVPPPSESDYGWFARVVLGVEDGYMRRMGCYRGTVVAMTDETITLQAGARMPRTFGLTLALLSDRIPLERRVGAAHRLKDVRLGDLVYLDLVPVRDGFVGIHLGIVRRPGGKVPPAEDAHYSMRSHDFYNAAQFVEEKVIPAMQTFGVWYLR
jgi:hypothetical protein